ncbi:MAG: inorganic phosphate transporter [Actinomycetaceae bacterium]|nr:inorganic phosphate transporter [Actinomycetaceae bacterium]
MTATITLVVVICVIALIFDFTNGFHDAANAIATSVATRALSTRQALTLAAVMDFVGAMLGTGVAETIGGGIINTHDMDDVGLVIVLGALIGAIAWNMITWWFALPSSSSHALIGALAGAGVVGAAAVNWSVIVDKVVVPMVVSPLVGFILAYFVMKIVLRFLHKATYRATMRGFRRAGIAAAAAMALGHGLQDAQKTMGVVMLALTAGNLVAPDAGIPLWVKIAAATAISLGTFTGGQRIMKTLGNKIIDMDPSRGFVAQMVSASVLYTTAFVWTAPISTTHVVTTSIMGVGATKRKSAVRWAITRSIVSAWIFTLPAAGVLSGGITWGLLHVIPV